MKLTSLAPAIFLSLALAFPAHADLVARIDTDRGEIEIVLDYRTAPLAVANFITLSQGTRARVDRATGNLTEEPLYVGEKFFRVLDDPGFKIAQTGSGTGTNAGGPGFTFRDEFDPAVRHTPYVLSMANSGPNTNGSQIFLTGGIDLPGLDDVHTVFGAIPGAAGRATIDAILAAGDDGSEITAVTIERTSAEAETFDEFAQGLPEVTPATGRLVTRDDEVAFRFADPQPAGTLLGSFRTADFADWTPLNGAFAGFDNAPAGRLAFDRIESDRAFYRLHRIHYPDSPTPSSLANRTLEISAPGVQSDFTFRFDETGNGGTVIPTQEGLSEGTIQSVLYDPDGYGARILIESDTLVPLNFQVGFDSEDDVNLIGRHSLSAFVRGRFQSFGSGTAALGKTADPSSPTP